ncbi:MAG: hypothetical protein H0W73_10570 [Bacteroidetes bacterium]|nr:hypothetical protein [Bacteroidota bacterium]
MHVLQITQTGLSQLFSKVFVVKQLLLNDIDKYLKNSVEEYTEKRKKEL